MVRRPEPTCIVPIGWSVAEAASSLCLRAGATKLQECAQFNWVLLVARPGDGERALTLAYWRALDAGRDIAEIDPLPQLMVFSVSGVAGAAEAGERLRRDLNRTRTSRSPG